MLNQTPKTFFMNIFGDQTQVLASVKQSPDHLATLPAPQLCQALQVCFHGFRANTAKH